MTAYRHGGGARGNVGVGTITSMRWTVAFIDRVSNLVPASGGADAESVSDAKKRGPLTLRTSQRAVTSRDFERLAIEASAEIARVRCLGPISPGGPARLLVVPKVRRDAQSQNIDDYALTDGLVKRISDYLEPRRLLGVTVEISTPYYQGVTVATHLRALPTASEDVMTRIRSEALDLLYDWVNPLTGGPEGSGWPWDTDLNAGPLAQLLGEIDGVDRVDEVLLFECDLRTARRYGPAKEIVHLDDRSLFLSAQQPRLALSEETVTGRRGIPQPYRRRGEMSGPRRPDWLVGQLPVGMLDNDFFYRFASIFQEEATTLLDDVDNLGNVIDPAVAPLPMLRFLAGWLGLPPLAPSLDEAYQRRYVHEAAEWRWWRGTKLGLTGLLDLLTGGPVEIADSGGIFRQGDVGDHAARAVYPTWPPQAGCRKRTS